MTFPDYRLFRPSGWTDLGDIGSYGKDPSTGNLGNWYDCHKFCYTRLRIGKENGKLFKYCPLCLITIEGEVNSEVTNKPFLNVRN